MAWVKPGAAPSCPNALIGQYITFIAYDNRNRFGWRLNQGGRALYTALMQFSRDDLRSCRLCPHQCKIDRFKTTGFCRTGSEPFVSSIVCHLGEEPVLSGEKGICNVFFAHCNMQCVYCQNHQISRNSIKQSSWETDTHRIADSIAAILDRGIGLLGFVSPSHQIIAMLEIIEELARRGYEPGIVYNTNAYDSVQSLKKLEGIVDIYLPDFKYASNKTGEQYSGVKNYYEIAKAAFKEMYRQKGKQLHIDDNGIAESGILVRHLVLPGHADDSVEILQMLAADFSPQLHLSLMSQYYPPEGLGLPSGLGRTLYQDEYNTVLKTMESLGFNGWAQLLESNENYRPDFDSDMPFHSL